MVEIGLKPILKDIKFLADSLDALGSLAEAGFQMLLNEVSKNMTPKSFKSVWDAIEDTPAAANMKLRASLMMILKDHITATKLTQAQAAQKFDVSQPRVSDLLRGKINLFSLDTLVNMAAAAQIELTLHARPRETVAA